VTAFLLALLPSAGVLLVFWIGIRAILDADRHERSAQARIEAAERKAARSHMDGAGDSSPPPGGAAPVNGPGE
jgi:hypothetical protein